MRMHIFVKQAQVVDVQYASLCRTTHLCNCRVSCPPSLPRMQLGVDGGAEDPALRPFWRGRMGLSKEEQLDLFEQVG